MEGAIRETHVPLAVETDAVELHLHVVVAVTGGIEHQPRGFVDLDDVADLERRMAGQRRDEPAAQVVEIQVAPAVARRLPDEPPAVLEKLHGRVVLDPPGGPLLAQDDPRLAGRGIRRDVLQDVLAPVGTVVEQLGAVRGPGNPVDVVADDGVVEGLAFAHVNLRRLLRGDVVNEQIDHGVRRARLGIGLDVVLALDLGLIELEVIVGDLHLVEPVVRDLRAVGGPPHRARLRELLAVDPARRPVLDAVLLAAVGRNLRLAAAAGVAQPEVARPVESLQRLVRGIRGCRLAASLDAPSAAAAAARARRRRRPNLRRQPGGHVVAIQLSVPDVLERLRVLPRDGERTGLDRPRNLAAHSLVLLVPGHRPQPILGAGGEVEGAGGEGQRQPGADERGGDAVLHWCVLLAGTGTTGQQDGWNRSVFIVTDWV